ncbi:MAG: YraN family protein [Gammaproteobacteria bacterium]|jgi:putative endonuclease
MTTRATGRRAELLARDFLRQQGLKLVEQNWSCRHGEIDLIMRERDVLVFVEVRFRKNSRFGTPAATVGHIKQRRLVLAAQHYLQRLGRQPPCRFDIIAMTAEPERQMEWIRNAFDATV